MKNYKRVLYLFLIFTTLLIGCSKQPINNVNKNKYVKAVHYFSDEWPINFWNSEMDNVDNDLQQIRKDGFNTIVLVIPWREFQPSIEPIQYNEHVFEKLDLIIGQAKDIGLDVILRIGYTWDFYKDENENIADRYYNILFEQNTMNAWMNYVETIYERVSKYSNIKGAFICWEDFWSPTYRLKAIENREESINTAKAIGYQEFIKSKYTIKEINEIYEEEFEQYNQVYMPLNNSQSVKIFYEYYDQVLNKILQLTQEKFPNISMEVRVDDDLVPRADGTSEWYSHKETYSSGDSSFTCIVYGIPMGFENKGERVTWQEAKNMFSYILDRVNNETDNKPIFIDQFLFADNTPGFEHNAQIKQDEVGTFLINIDDILVQKSMGYGVWAYKDYRANVIYNSQFGNELDGYNSEGNVSIDVEHGSNKVKLESGASIEQLIPIQRNHFGNEVKFTFELEAKALNKSSELEIFINDNLYKINIDEAKKYRLELEESEISKIKIQVIEGMVILDNLNLYNQVQESLLYNTENKELEYIEDLRRLNNKIDITKQDLEKNKDFYNFYDEFYSLRLEEGESICDNPWKINIGKIPLEGYDKSIFISPHTGFSTDIRLDSSNKELQFQYMFHPLAIDFGSDGIILEVIINGEKGKHITEKIEILPIEGIQEKKINLNKFKNEDISIEFQIYNEKGKNDIGDWGVLINPLIN